MATRTASRSLLVLLLLSGGCAYTAEDSADPISPGAGKADGATRVSFQISPEQPVAQFAFECDEWWFLDECDVEVTLTPRDLVAGGVSEVDRILGTLERTGGEDTVDFVGYAASVTIVRRSDRERVTESDLEFQLVGVRDPRTEQVGVDAIAAPPVTFEGGDRDDVYLLRVERRGGAPWHLDGRGRVSEVSFDLHAKWD